MPRFLPLLLGFLQAVGPISTDMYLPAFPAIEQAFRLRAGGAEITLATWIIGLSIGQILFGTLLDRYGRRLPLLAGTAIYTAASVGCALAPHIGALAWWRVLAAVGASASMVVPRAVVRDFADGHAAARLMSQLMLIMGVAPILAPSLGSLLLGVVGWRAIFWVMAFYGLVGTVLAARSLPDTLASGLRLRGVAAQLARYWHVLRDPGFLTHGLMLSFGAFAVFSYLGSSPAVFITRYHVSPVIYGVIFGLNASGYVLATQINSRILHRFGVDTVLHAASTAFVVVAGLLFLAALANSPAPVGIVLPLVCCLACLGFTAPNATVGALSRHAAHAGTASALLGTLQFAIGAIGGLLAGPLTDGTARPMAGLILAAAILVKIADRFRPRQG